MQLEGARATIDLMRTRENVSAARATIAHASNDPIETRLLPQWGILTKGSEVPDDLRTDDGLV